ncbi:STM2901 family protein [Citrobacter sp. UYEF32]|uniref:STM2901 family protein n=1 Tax=Citrobacter sp. UYEF32 TaxID=3156347 RepID=UPI0033994B07
MDTVEELNGTYYYAGKSNLTAAELFFMVFCEKTIDQFGLGIVDFSAVIAIVSGRNDLATRAKPNGAVRGTSYASKAARAVFKKAKFPYGLSLPTWLGGYTPWTARKQMVRNIAPFVGRTIPLIGVVILSVDVSLIVYNTISDYNAIARGNDKIW